MRLRNWLLTGTSLGLLALAPLPVQAQSAELTAAYQAYVAAQASGDAAATEAALGIFTEQCIVAGYGNIDECVAALSGGGADAAAAAAAAAQAEAEAAAAAQAQAEAEAAAAAQAQAEAEAAAAAQAQAEADAAAAAQAEAEAAAAAQAQAEAEAAAAAQAQAEADAAAKAQAEADAAAAAQAEADAAAAAQAEADAAAAAQAQADADAAAAAAAAQAEADAKAAADAQAATEAANAQFVSDLNAALAEYQAALDSAAGGGDFAAAQAQADAASARILELCTANGYADIASCIGQELPPLPQPAAPAEQPAEQPAAETPAEQPAAEAPAEQPAADAQAEQPVAEQPATEEPAPVGEPAVIEAPPPIDPAVQAQADIGTAIELYNSGIAQLQAGNADGQTTVDLAMQQITTACQTAGNGDVAACLAAFGFPPLAEVPQVAAAEPAPAPELSPAIDEIVTPDAVEALPVNVAPEAAAPLLDSAKDVSTEVAAGQEPVPQPEQPTEPAAPPPTSDTEAQAQLEPVEVQSVEAEQGAQIAQEAIVLNAAVAEPQAAAEALPQNVTIVNNVTNITNNTTIINNNAPTAPVVFQIGVNLVINNPGQERDRMYRPDEDRIYYEELRNGRTRETIVRPNGVRIVTIRNRWGDVLKRSRFSPDGREYILAYYDEDRDGGRDRDRDSDRDGFFIDPGRDLPPLRLNIPARDYILDVDYADEEEVELFFRQPPVEQVRRIYSVEEVKRSSRIRDSVRRIEVGALTFDSGKATISSSQVGALSKVARAMLAILDENPAETFLIEGHTDATGGDAANLVLSDQRAAVVAQILTDFYKVPPENLTTQGYGERYLKVNTQASEPLNRRVTIKRITSLITVADR